MIVVLTGGTGGAKFVDGVRRVLPEDELTIIVNTGDDHEWWGLYVSPDLDSITYMLAGIISQERGWGVRRDTFHCLQAMRDFGQPTWFSVGDRDLATHLVRTELLGKGKTLSQVTEILAERFATRTRILPMSDQRIETRVKTPVGELSFEEYFVQRRFQDPVTSVRFAGAREAEPAPGVLEAIGAAQAVLIAPSNPVTSIGPILSVPGIQDALRHASAPVVAVSPIIGTAAISGPAGALMAAQGFEVSAAGVVAAYGSFLDAILVDETDLDAAEIIRANHVEVHATNILMKTGADRVRVARAALAAACPETLSASVGEVE